MFPDGKEDRLTFQSAAMMGRPSELFSKPKSRPPITTRLYITLLSYWLKTFDMTSRRSAVSFLFSIKKIMQFFECIYCKSCYSFLIIKFKYDVNYRDLQI